MFSLSTARFFSATPRPLATYAVVGLGQMGQHMLRHIHERLDAEDRLLVNDVNEGAIAATLEAVKPHPRQAASGASLAQIAKEADCIVTMLPEGKHVRGVVEELVKLRGKNSRPLVISDSSTIDIPTSLALTEAMPFPHEFVDAPVSGGMMGARDGTLSFMVGRSSNSNPLLAKVWDAMGSRVFFCGKPGAGLAAKLANNYLLALTNVATADSFQLARLLGLDMQTYAKIVATLTGKLWALDTNCPIAGVREGVPSNVGYKGGFATKLTRKDLLLACGAAESVGQPLFLGAIGLEIYNKACERKELADRDLAVFYEWLGEYSGGEAAGDVPTCKR